VGSNALLCIVTNVYLLYKVYYKEGEITMKLGIIIGSTRQGRMSQGMAAWVAAEAKKHEDVEVDLIDLRDFELPMFDEAISPKYNPDRQPTGAVKQWLDTLSSTDAFIVVTPEYNRSISGVLKNAFDHIDYQLAGKAIAIASHGSYNGAFALANLRNIIPELGAISTPKMLGIPYGSFDDTGAKVADLAMYEQTLQTLVEEVLGYAQALATLRS
jgi:NAD(P)H-dependent FMN reductase